MRRFKSNSNSIKFTFVAVLLMITVLLLSSCGSTTPTTSPTSAPTAAATPAATKAAVSTPLPSYPDAVAVDLNEASQKAASAISGDLRINKNTTYQSFLTKDDPETVAKFYKQNLVGQGFRLDLDFSTSNIMTDIVRWTFSQGQQTRAVVAIKFNKEFGVTSTVQDIPGLSGKIKVGDTLVVVVSGEK